MGKAIVTIGRQCGSGGREIGKRLADRLGVPFYDRKLIELAAQESGIDPNVFAHVDETATNSLLYALSMGAFTLNSAGMVESSINDKVFFASAEFIRKVAAEGSCVIVGRCADYILREEEALLSVFIHGQQKDRVARIAKELKYEPGKAEEVVRKLDKQRANYYHYYASRKWGTMTNYALAIDTSILGIDGALDLLEVAARKKMED
ncbi:MAG: cytidylate kinase-like family protein [Oscillospiraceae bacterium]|nr:cytidylate kinase-like family protein [Oscillospiraceae bacterium]